MFKNPVLTRRLLVYICGLFLLSVGIVLSIQAGFGASPLSALPYSLVMLTHLSMGVMVVASNFLFIALQFVFGKRLNRKECFVQLSTSLLFWAFIDAELYMMHEFFPHHLDLFIRALYLVSSLIIIGFALLLYLPPKFSPLSYDALTEAVACFFGWSFGKAKVVVDVTFVSTAVAIGLIFFHNAGSIGIGTLLAATTVGRIAGVLMKYFQEPLQRWIFKE